MGEQSTGHGGAIIEQFTQGTQALMVAGSIFIRPLEFTHPQEAEDATSVDTLLHITESHERRITGVGNNQS
jgi:hypothetical protein